MILKFIFIVLFVINGWIFCFDKLWMVDSKILSFIEEIV